MLGERSSARAPPSRWRSLSALGFFGSIVLHELGHAIAALRNGIGISSIQLWIFGGVARMDRESDSPATEFKVAIAGPAGDPGDRPGPHPRRGSSPPGWSEFSHAFAGRVAPPASPGVLAMFAWLASINPLVLVFNLLPAFPMDGGRIARAIAWWKTGDRTAATRFAADLGRVFAYIFIGGGLLLIVASATSSAASGWR